MSKVVNILLSTYNGEKYLGELLHSLVNQSYPFIKITIRDDGSSDDTISIVENFVERHNHIQLIKGQNLQVIRSFFTLLQEADYSGYYAFCDQDDVWRSDKIERAVDAINRYPVSKPVMYCSDYSLVDENLNPIGKPWKVKKKPVFGNALVENIATGCTIVINQAARAVLINKLPTKNVLMHDWWIYIVISALGKVIYDTTPSILYRQHSSNVVGANAHIISELVHRVRKYRNRDDFKLISKQVSEFHELYKSEMDSKTLEVTEKFLNDRFFNRVKIFLEVRFIDNR
ncbi:MAG: glycosyltransferase family 2 protein [Syntrophomonadaceae bacterium]